MAPEKQARIRSRRPRRNHPPAFKAKVAVAALRGEKTLAGLAQQHGAHPHRITQWKTQWLERAADVFGGQPKPAEPAVALKARHAKSGELARENDFLEGALIKAGGLRAKR